MDVDLVSQTINLQYSQMQDLYGDAREPQVDTHTFVLDTNHEENDSNDDDHQDNLAEMLHDPEINVDEKNVKNYKNCLSKQKKHCTTDELRYKLKNLTELDSDVKKNGSPAKMLWYLPIISRLKKLYANPKNAKLLRWHAEKHGINPFKSLSSRHSTWLILLCIYNLPPWLCMKRKYIMMSLLIQGLKQPENDIDVYLRSLIDDMIDLWEKDVEIYDAYKKERFQLFAMIFCTINDFPAYGNLLGYGTKGEKACPICENNTHSQWLTNYRKTIYIGHWRSLDRFHPYRRKKKLVDGSVEDRSMVEPMDGFVVFSQVANLDITFGKKVKAPPKCIWKKSLLGLLLNIPGKTKDVVNARRDMVEMGIRMELAPQETNGTKMYLSPACYTLSKAEKTLFCECLHGVKVPSGYSANIKNLVSMKDLKLLGKSHDCHILLTQMIPIAIRGLMPSPVRQTITKLCLFFNMIHSKVIDHEKLDELQRDIILILCQLEMYFPPSFFDVMVHLMSYIVEEIKLAGPGSIVQGYAAEEVVQFCTNYMDDVADIGLLQPRHQGRLDGVGTIGRKDVTPTNDDFEQAHFIVLQNMTCIKPYIHEHMSYLAENNRRRDQRWLEAKNKRTFSQWLADKGIGMSPTYVDADVIQLGYRPRRVLQYQGYDINRYMFYTEQQDDKSSVQNSRVTLIATMTDSSRMTIAKKSYYGVDEIWELDYNSVVIHLLKCKWVDNTRGVKVDSDGFTCVNLSTNGYLSDPFILAKQATQVFYVKDPKDKRWHIVLQSKRSIVGVDDVVDEDEYNKFDVLPPFSIGFESDAVLSDTIYLRSDHQEGHED
ncbi:hypothetical protein Tco_1108643 [Tanacetum coccineum]